MIEKLKEQINEHSKTFLDKWIKSAEPIDVLKRDDVKDYVYLLYKWKGSDRIRVCCLAVKESTCKPSFFGPLAYYISVLACAAVKDGYAKRHGDEVYAKQIKFEQEFIKKYNLPEKYFWMQD